MIDTPNMSTCAQESVTLPSWICIAKEQNEGYSHVRWSGLQYLYSIEASCLMLFCTPYPSYCRCCNTEVLERSRHITGYFFTTNLNIHIFLHLEPHPTCSLNYDDMTNIDYIVSIAWTSSKPSCYIFKWAHTLESLDRGGVHTPSVVNNVRYHKFSDSSHQFAHIPIPTDIHSCSYGETGEL